MPLQVTSCVIKTSRLPRHKSQKPEEERLEKEKQKEAIQSPHGTREPAGPLLRRHLQALLLQVGRHGAGTAEAYQAKPKSPQTQTTGHCSSSLLCSWGEQIQDITAICSCAKDYRRELRDGGCNFNKRKKPCQISILDQAQE